MRAVAALMVFATHIYWNGGIRDMSFLTPLGRPGPQASPCSSSFPDTY